MVLFGGEPLLFKDRLYRILETGKINSISTNLLLLDSEIAERLNGINIATTLIPAIFKKKDLKVWHEKLVILTEKEIEIMLLVTISEDTIGSEPLTVFEFLKSLEKYSICSVLFEQLLDYNKNQDYYDKVDLWLCEMHEYFKDLRFVNKIENQIKNGWYFDCSNTFTLYPDGRIRKYCTQFLTYTINRTCYKCPNNITCRPCMLQNRCVYPKKLGDLVISS